MGPRQGGNRSGLHPRRECCGGRHQYAGKKGTDANVGKYMSSELDNYIVLGLYIYIVAALGKPRPRGLHRREQSDRHEAG
jgi:hypothetical protein